MQKTAADPNRFAQDLFQPLPRRYDLLEELLSFGQNGRWRREMVAHVDHDEPSAILDVATGTAGVALALDAAYQRTTSQGSTSPKRCCDADTSESPRAGARTGCGSSSGKPNGFPFPTVRSTRSRSPICCATSPIPPRRSVSSRASSRPGAAIASLEFSVPPNRFWRSWWWLYTRGVLPVAGYRHRRSRRGVGSDVSSDPTSPRTTTATRCPGPFGRGRKRAS